MPNVELHGFDYLNEKWIVLHNIPEPRVKKFDSRYTSSVKFLLMREIEKALKSQPYGGDVVLTQFTSECRDLSGMPAPYVRV